MIDIDEVKALLASKEQELGFTEGFKLLYCPWRTIDVADTLFLSLNPGRPPRDIDDPRTVSDERGNSYVVERLTTNSPITEQFLKFCGFLGADPDHVLAGVVYPFRSNAWSDLTPQQKKVGLRIGTELWTKVLNESNIKRIVALSNEATSVVTSIKGAKLSRTISSGWGPTKLKSFDSPDGTSIVQLPHLSQFKLFSRADCHEPLREIFRGWI